MKCQTLSVTPAKEVPAILCERDRPITLAVAPKASGIQLKTSTWSFRILKQRPLFSSYGVTLNHHSEKKNLFTWKLFALKVYPVTYTPSLKKHLPWCSSKSKIHKKSFITSQRYYIWYQRLQTLVLKCL